MMRGCNCSPYWQDKDELPGDEPIGQRPTTSHSAITVPLAQIEAALRTVADEVYVYGDPSGGDVPKVHDEIIARALAALREQAP